MYNETVNGCLIAVDLDWTCLDEYGHTSEELRKLIEDLAETNIIVYATGRYLQSALMAIEKGGLPLPHYLISDIGNRIFLNQQNKFSLDHTYEDFNEHQWDRLNTIYSGLSTSEFKIFKQGGEIVRRFSYWAKEEAEVKQFCQELENNQSLQDVGILRWDGPTQNNLWWVDILPACSGKGTAVSYIAFVEGIPNKRVLAVGDSLNDIDLLSGRFLSAAPKNVAPKLIATLRKRDQNILIMNSSGPQGTYTALLTLLEEMKQEKNPVGVLGDDLRIAALRSIKYSPLLVQELSVWPDQFQNWGLKLGTQWPVDQITTGNAEYLLQRGRNWWWESLKESERNTILNRYRAIPVKYLLSRLIDYSKKAWPNARLIGGMVSGGYLYGQENQMTNDLDLVLLFENLQEPALGFEIEIEGLSNAFPQQFAKRLRYDHVGLGILDIQELNPNTSNPTVFQLVSSMEGSGLPLFGTEVSDSPMPRFDLVIQANQIIKAAKQLVQSNHPDKERKVRHLLRETEYVLSLADKDSKCLSIPNTNHSIGEIKDDSFQEEFYRYHRMIAQSYFKIIYDSLRTEELSEVNKL